MDKIVIIGGGNMGEAIIKGLNRPVKVCEPDRAKARRLVKKYQVSMVEPAGASNADVVILAVKPQDMGNVLAQIKSNGQLFISVAAGLATASLEHDLGGKPKVVRCMPNMPATIGEGITALCAGKFASSRDLAKAQNLLKSVGTTVLVKEEMMDAVTAVSGSGPAYVFLLVEHWMAAAKALGFSAAPARELVYQTLLGSAHLLVKSDRDAADLRAKVTSKGGTTQAALEVFANEGLGQTMKKALMAARARAKELARSSAGSTLARGLGSARKPTGPRNG